MNGLLPRMIKIIVSLMVLFFHFEAWKFWTLKRRIQATINHRKAIGMFTPEHSFTLSEVLQYGRWLASMKISEWLLK